MSEKFVGLGEIQIAPTMNELDFHLFIWLGTYKPINMNYILI